MRSKKPHKEIKNSKLDICPNRFNKIETFLKYFKNISRGEYDYNKSILKGIVKIASKMGISTIQSYQGSKIFEAMGISEEVINKYFTGTVSRVGGITLEDINKRVQEFKEVCRKRW